MHEYSIASALLDQVEQEARRHREAEVLAIRIRVGELAGVDIALLGTAWTLVSEGTCCAKAALEVESEAARWVCPGCGDGIAPGSALCCAACARPARLAAGDALVLERIELEVSHV